MSDARYCPTCGYLLGNVRDASYLLSRSWKCPSCGYYGDGVEKRPRPVYPSTMYDEPEGLFSLGSHEFLKRTSSR